MSKEDGFEALKLMGNKVNAQIITLLRRHPMSPRDLSRYLAKKEPDIVRRLKAMEKHGLVKGAWGNRLGHNVKMYSLTAHDIAIKLEQDGIQLYFGKRSKKREQQNKSFIVLATEPSAESSDDAIQIIGRANELKLLSDDKRNFFFVEGIAGIGKTSLAKKFVHHQAKPQKVFWHTFKEIDTFAYIAGRVALFLSKNGVEDLLKYLDTPERGSLDESQTVEMLIAALNKLGKCVLVFDDYHKVRDEKISILLRHLQIKLSPANKTIVLSRSKPPFFLSTDRSRELSMSGLSFTDSKEMVSHLGAHVDHATLAGIWKRFAGHPMALKIFCMLAKEGLDSSRPPSNVSPEKLLEYFRNEMLELLNEDELSILMSLSVFRAPVRIQALRSSIQMRRNLNYLLYSLERKMLVNRTMGQEFFLHDILREALYSTLSYPEEAHKSAAVYYLSENSPESVVESLYHLVKCRNTVKVASILEEEVAEEKYRFLEEGYATPILEILGQMSISSSGMSKRSLVHLFNIEGKALSMLERWQEAEERLYKALEIAKELDDELLAAYSQKILSEALYLKGDFPNAEANLLGAASVFQRHVTQKQLKSTYMKLARLYFATGRPEESKSYSDMAKSIA